MATDLSTHYVLLNTNGASATVAGGEAFWSQSPDELDAYGRGWLLSEYEFSSDWKQWEMHPEADELVRVISGETELRLEWPTGIQSVTLRANQAYVIPQGVWHTARASAPCRMLHVTMGAGTQHRPL